MRASIAAAAPLLVVWAAGLCSAVHGDRRDAVPAAAPLALAPTRLLVEFAATPVLGIDVAVPRFSWLVEVAAGRRVQQGAYRLQVCAAAVARAGPWDGSWECDCGGQPGTDTGSTAKNQGACVWDSGRVNASTHANVPYGRGSTTAGAAPLRSDTAYGWRVMWWPRADGGVAPPRGSNFSSVARMLTGFIGGASEPGGTFPGPGGGAKWVGASPAAFAASRLGTTQLRTEFAVPAGAVVTRARAFVACPGYYTMSIDGVVVDGGAVQGYASRAVQFHPHGGQSDFAWPSTRTTHPHGGASYVW